MNSSQIFDLIETIANTPGKNDKLALVKEGLKDCTFKKVIEYALNPSIIYGIQKLDVTLDPCAPQNKNFDEILAWSLLEKLSARRLTGNAARDTINYALNVLDPKSAELLKRIILKDLRAGFGESTVNKAWPGLIPDFPYMRCSLPKDVDLSKFGWTDGVYSQEKADGMFINISISSDRTLSITSRNGSPVLIQDGSLAELILKSFPVGHQVHGELLVMRDGIILERAEGNGVINHINNGGSFQPDEEPIIRVWDIIPLSSAKTKGKCEIPYDQRFKLLLQSVPHSPLIEVVRTRVVHSLAEAYDHYFELVAQGKEGTIIKHPHAIWKDGTSKEQVKLKVEVDVELRVTGFRPGKGKNADTFGAMECVTEDELLEVGVPGFNDKDRGMIWKHKEEWLGAIVTVKANAVMYPVKPGEKHSLFLPRFVERRHDKSVADTLQRVIDQYDAIIKRK